MKKRSDVSLPRRKKSVDVCLTQKQQPDLSSLKKGFSYLPFEFTRQLFSDGCSMSDLRFPRHFLPADGEYLRSTQVSCIVAVLLDVLTRSECVCDSENCCGDDFYAACVASYCSKHRTVEDRELLVIFFKQMMIILRHCGIVSAANGTMSVSRTPLSWENLYLEIFNAFWAGVSWDRLFPSMTSLAATLQKDRYVLAELVGARDGVFFVEDIASDYSDIMGLSHDDLMLYFSFFDFSFFTWMSLFGIIEYRNEGPRVQACMTDWGRSFFLAIE